MLQELIVLSLASSMGWELVRYFYPGKISVRVAPAIVILISYLFTFAFTSSVIMAFASAGGVALFNVITRAGTAAPEQLSLRKPSIKYPERKSHRIPDL